MATPAQLPAPGWPEFEAGWNGAKGGDAARSQSVPMLFKLAWSGNWAVLVGMDAYDWQRDFDGNSAHRGGDTTLTLKYKLPVNDNVALGAGFGIGLPTARPPFGGGGPRWGINTIASVDFGATHVDVNAGAARLGAVDEGPGRCQEGWAIAASHPLFGEFGLTGELSGLAQRGTTAQTQGLFAINYNVSRKLVPDIAFAAGLSHAAPNWQLIAGMIVQLGHWF